MKVLAILNTSDSVHTVRPEMEQFIEIYRMGVNLEVCTQPDTEYAKIITEQGIKIVGNYPKHKKDKNAVNEIRQLLINNHYDILHLLIRKDISCGIKAAKGLPVKVVVYRGASGMYWHDPSAYENALNPRVNKVICVCNNIKNNLQKQLFFKKEKAITIYKGHRMEWYKDIKPVDRNLLKITGDDFVIACTANNRKWKGIPTFLDAIDLLPQNSKIQILLIGNGMDTPYYKNKINNNKNKKKIHILGFRNDALSIAKTADVMMQTSYKNEGLSRSTIEGMALGCVPIVTNAGGNPELVLHEKCGLVVPVKDAKAMADAILRLYTSPELMENYKKAAFERISNDFTVEKTAKETIKLYNELN